MPLKDGATNEILPFAVDGSVDAGDLLSQEEYKDHLLRKRGHIPGIALRELQNKASRQSAHMAAGLAQFIANLYSPGVKDDGDLDKIEEGLLSAIVAIIKEYSPEIPQFDRYNLCEFYYFRHPILKAGFQPAQGGLLKDAANLYPEAWEYLKSPEGQILCKTESEWQDMTKATWATLADGTKVGWNGIGGAPFYAPNYETGELRLPDLRGMYTKAAGFDELGVGEVHGDGIRNIVGSIGGDILLHGHGAFENWWTGGAGTTAGSYADGVILNASRVVPTANKNQPRVWGALACVYLGGPK